MEDFVSFNLHGQDLETLKKLQSAGMVWEALSHGEIFEYLDDEMEEEFNEILKKLKNSGHSNIEIFCDADAGMRDYFTEKNISSNIQFYLEVKNGQHKEFIDSRIKLFAI